MTVLRITVLLILAVAVLGAEHDQCSPTTYCPDGTLCCADNYHCCPFGYNCCYNYTKCCRSVIDSSTNSTAAVSSSVESPQVIGNSNEIDQNDYQRLQKILGRVFPRLNEARRDGIMNRPLRDNPVVVVYN